MAYLNVRERRIEAKIAYLVSEPVGGSLDRFRQAGRDLRAGRVEVSSPPSGAPSPLGGSCELVSLTWAEHARFRDCSVRLEVLAPRTTLTNERFDELLREADGVVVVLDAVPSAQGQNHASMRAVREGVARVDRTLPVVLQIDKSDLPDAMPVLDLVGGLNASSLRRIVTSGKQSVVLEPLEAALAEVLASMNGEPQKQGSGADPKTESRADSDGGHPLLASLRQVLRETVREYVEALETRVTSRIDASIDRLTSSTAPSSIAASERAATPSDDPQIVRLQSELVSLATSFREASAKLDAIRARVHAIAAEMTTQSRGPAT